MQNILKCTKALWDKIVPTTSNNYYRDGGGLQDVLIFRTFGYFLVCILSTTVNQLHVIQTYSLSQSLMVMISLNGQVHTFERHNQN